jgi:hypothetical protein
MKGYRPDSLERLGVYKKDLLPAPPEEWPRLQRLRQDLEELKGWLTGPVKAAYRDFLEARKEWEKWEKEEGPDQKQDSGFLNLSSSHQTHPHTQAKAAYEKALRLMLEAIRSAENLPRQAPWDSARRREIREELRQEAEGASVKLPNLDLILFPNYTDITNKGKLDFVLPEYLEALSALAVRISNRLNNQPGK